MTSPREATPVPETRHAAILIAASPTAAFFSQIAVARLALQNLEWTRWRFSLHVCLGGGISPETVHAWRHHLPDVELIWEPESAFARLGTWAQADAVFRLAPRDADVLIAMDADTLAVRPFEDVLDDVADSGRIAGVVAHVPFPDSIGIPTPEAWRRVAEGVAEPPTDYSHTYCLLGDDVPEDQRIAPFYLNFGVVFFPQKVFGEVFTRYLDIRPRLMERLVHDEFSGQIALTLAMTGAAATVRPLPQRYNFPNDAVAAERYPEELERVVVYHYLRTTWFDRHEIFASGDGYQQFLELPLSGVDLRFRDSVRSIIGDEYQFD